MLRRALCLLPLLAAAACATPAPAPAPAPPRRTPPASLSERVRQEPWITRFWAQLSRAQRRRVLARLARRDPPVRTAEDAAPLWDALGLPERDTLLYGPPPAAARPNGNSAAGPALRPLA